MTSKRGPGLGHLPSCRSSEWVRWPRISGAQRRGSASAPWSLRCPGSRPWSRCPQTWSSGHWSGTQTQSCWRWLSSLISFSIFIGSSNPENNNKYCLIFSRSEAKFLKKLYNLVKCIVFRNSSLVMLYSDEDVWDATENKKGRLIVTLHCVPAADTGASILSILWPGLLSTVPCNCDVILYCLQILAVKCPICDEVMRLENKNVTLLDSADFCHMKHYYRWCCLNRSWRRMMLVLWNMPPFSWIFIRRWIRADTLIYWSRFIFFAYRGQI